MVTPRNRALLAPMSGITDLPFRRLAYRLGAGLVIAEMVTDRQLAVEDRATLHRVMGASEITPYVIQMTGRDAKLMAEAARVAEGLGADVIDINMGCPARKLTKGLAGSALMREPKLALSIIEAVVGAVELPVTLKMRLGWDEDMLNAAQLAAAAERAGVQMFSVHGRTRNQFYKGKADWRRIRSVVESVDKPVYANGDILSFADAKECLAQSGAAGVMIGRGAQGRPWFVGQVGRFLSVEINPPAPGLAERRDIILQHFEDMLAHYGDYLGVRIARKHLGWYIDDLPLSPDIAKRWRAKINREEQPAAVLDHLEELFNRLTLEVAQ